MTSLVKSCRNAAFAALLIAPATSALAAEPGAAPIQVPTIEEMAAFPAYSSFTISPDGKHVAALEARGEDRVIVVWPTEDLKSKPRVLGSKDMKIASVRFIKSDRLAVTLWQPYDMRFDGVTKTFVYKLFITDLDGKKWTEPLQMGRTMSRLEEQVNAISVPEVLDTLPGDPDHILVLNAKWGSEGDVYKVDLKSMRAEKLMRAEADTAGYITDLKGNIRARIRATTDGEGAYIATEIRPAEGGKWEEHFRSYVKDREEVAVIGFTDDPDVALIRSNKGADKTAIYEYSISRRQLGEKLFAHKFFNADNALVLRESTNPQVPAGTILAFGYDGPAGGDLVSASNYMDHISSSLRTALGIRQSKVRFVDPASGDAASIDYDADLQWQVTGLSQDLNKAIIVTQAPNRPPAYYLLDGNNLRMLAATYPTIDTRALGMTRLVYYIARDGLTIPAFLTKPSEALCGPGPWKTVIHPHGGPWARDNLGFDGFMWIPMMTSRCMAVLQPQYRGSFGWGRRLNREGDAEWGGKMQDDKDDAVRWLIDQKVAQPGHVAMFGFSYGGYASMAAAVRPNGLYKCAIAGAGVSDIRKIWARFYDNPFYQDAQGPTVRGLSPLDKADQIEIPIMVYHGDRDRTVPIEQSEWFVDKARKAGKQVEYHALSDYAHGPGWTRAVMAQQLRYIDDYLKTGCGGGGL